MDNIIVKLKNFLQDLALPIFVAALSSLLGLASTICGIRYLGDESFGYLFSVISVANILCAFSMGGVSQLSIKYLHSDKTIIKHRNLFTIAFNQFVLITCLSLLLYILNYLTIEVILIMALLFIFRLIAIINRAHTKFLKSIFFEGSNVALTVLITCIWQVLFPSTSTILNFTIVLSAIVFFQAVDCARYALPALRSKKKGNEAEDYYKSITLGLLGVITAIQNNIDVVLLNYLTQYTEVTNFKKIIMLLLAFNMIHVVVNKIYGPKIALFVSKNHISELNTLWQTSVIIQLIVGTLASAMLYILLVKLRDYTMFDIQITYIGLIGIIISSVSFAFRSFLHQALIQLNLSTRINIIYLQSLTVTLFTSPALISIYGYSGAVLSYGTGQAVCSLLCYKYFKKQTHKSI